MKLCKMLFKLIIFIAFVSSCQSEENDNGFFTVVGSKLLRKNSKYLVVVTPHNIKEPEYLQLKIRSTDVNATNYFETAQNVTIDNGGVAKTVEFDLKGQPVGDYSIEVKSSESRNFTKEARLNMNVKEGSVFVQTDKSIYKPADKVNFRVVVLNDEMKPRENVKVVVFITDGSDNRIKQFDDVVLKKGVYQNELKLSELPVLGTWKIHVTCNGKEELAKDFEVAEYTLPKFLVKIDANDDANFKEGKIRAVVSAKYTFGRIAKGNATITAQISYPRWYWRNPGHNEDIKVVKTVQVNGKHSVEFDIDEELKITEKSYEKNVQLFVTFKEELTGREMNASTTVTIHPTPHKIEMMRSSEKFKPGLPFKISCFVLSHEKNAPIHDDKHPLQITITYYFDLLKNCTRRYPYYHAMSVVEETTTDDGIMSTTTEATTTTAAPLRICRDEKSYNEITNVSISNGMHEIDIKLPNNITRIDVKANYLGTENSIYYITKDETESNQYIQIVEPKRKWWLKKKVKIDVIFTDDNIAELTYHIIAKGNIVDSNTFSLPKTSVKSKTHQFEIMPKISMMPQSKIIVFYLTGDGEIISDSAEIEFEEDLDNHVDIELSKSELLPGDEITISVSSNPNSYVALLGVDQSVLLLKSGNDIDKTVIFSEINQYSEINEYNYGFSPDYDWRTRWDFENSNAFIITNAKKEFEKPYIPYDYGYGVYALAAHSHDRLDDSAGAAPQPESNVLSTTVPMRELSGAPGHAMRKSGSSNQPIQIRKEFPETWLFESFDLDAETTTLNLTKKVPDTITSWVITGFSVDLSTGLGIVKSPSMFRVFQPFFVTTNLPYSIKRGEVVSIPILLFNYLDADQEVELTLFNTDKEFEFTEVNQNENEVKRSRRSLDEKRTKDIIVKSQEGLTIPFMIRPLKVGHIKIKVIAKSATAGDGLEKLLIVEPEGVTKFNNKAIFIDLRENHEFKTDVNIEIPSNAVPDSTRIEDSAVGDLLGSSIENLDKLIKMPYGCGEQNMLNFVPNIVVLDYLTTINKLTPEIETKAKNFMESGYQRELTYKHDDGSYSAFGKSDKHGSTWLTAFVAKSFNKASKYIQIDEKVIDEALDFLVGVQSDADGSFPEFGQVFHSDMQGGSSKGVALTAYTLITFLERKNTTKYQQNIERALNYVKNNLETTKDNYSLAIIAYALQIANDPSADLFLQKLDIRAEKKDGKTFWKKEVKKSEGAQDHLFRSEPKSINVEMTAYALQAFVEAGNETDAIPMMRWLVSQRNENGGFESTQDTVVGLQALSRIAMKIYSPSNDIEIEVTPDIGSVSKINVNRANSLILQKNELDPTARKFLVSAKGNGFGILNFAYRYNVDVNSESPRFNIDTKLHENSNKNFLHLIVCTNFATDENLKRSNMAVMEVQLPSGFTFDSDTVEEIKSMKNVKKIETKESDTIVVIYFDSIDENHVCPAIKAYRAHSVAKQKPVPVKVYDYYDTSRKATTFYNPPEISLCDICDGADECKDDCEVPEVNIVM